MLKLRMKVCVCVGGGVKDGCHPACVSLVTRHTNGTLLQSPTKVGVHTLLSPNTHSSRPIPT
mgnify:CR=1 FL=1